MSCATALPPPLNSVSVAVLNALLNAWLAYKEYELYKYHRKKLNELTERNMKLAHLLFDAHKELVELRNALEDKIGEEKEPECEACCSDYIGVTFNAMSNTLNAIPMAEERLHDEQVGMHEVIFLEAMKDLPRATEAATREIGRQEALCDRMKADWRRTQVSSGHRGEFPSPSVLANIAIDTASGLNTSSIILSHFINESMRSVGIAYGRYRELHQPQFQVGLKSTLEDNRFGVGQGQPNYDIGVYQQPQYSSYFNPSISVYGNNNYGISQSGSP